MSLERAKEFLKKYNLDGNIEIHDTSSATVELAAKAIGCEESEIAKTLAFLDRDNKGFLIVCDGDAKIDNRKFKDTFNTKAKMIKKEDLERLIGHEMGGVCPFGVRDDVKIYLDKSLKKHEYIHPACGLSNSSIKLSLEKLENIVNYEKYVDVSK